MMKVDSLEVGHRFITVYALPWPEVLELAEAVHKALPEKLQQIQRGSRFHSPELFHHFGQGPKTGRKNYKHFHILFDREPTDEDIENLLKILLGLGCELSKCDTHGMDKYAIQELHTKENLNKSVEVYQKLMEKHK